MNICAVKHRQTHRGLLQDEHISNSPQKKMRIKQYPVRNIQVHKSICAFWKFVVSSNNFMPLIYFIRVLMCVLCGCLIIQSLNCRGFLETIICINNKILTTFEVYFMLYLIYFFSLRSKLKDFTLTPREAFVFSFVEAAPRQKVFVSLKGSQK